MIAVDKLKKSKTAKNNMLLNLKKKKFKRKIIKKKFKKLIKPKLEKKKLLVFLFIKKLFNSIFKQGKKFYSAKYFYLLYNIFLKKKLKKKKSISSFFYFFIKIYTVMNPYILNINLTVKGKKKIIPKIDISNKNLKKIKLAANWIKISVYKRPEKTLFLKLLSELNDIKLFKGNSILLKKNYINTLLENKYFFRFLKVKKWI